MTITFKLRTQRKNGTVPVWVRVRDNKADISVPTDIYLLPDRWNAKAGRVKPFNKEQYPDLYKWAEDTNRSLDGIRDDIIEYVDACKDKNITPTREGIDAIVHKKREATKAIPKDILGYLDWLISAMESGAFRIKGETYNPHTIKCWKTFKGVYERFEKDYNGIITWSNIDKTVADSFTTALEDYGYMVKMQNKMIICMKALIGYATRYHHLHTNTDAIALFTKKTEKAGCTATQIYLTVDEINALAKMDIPVGSLKDQVRDLFIIGCWTGQRVSDYSRLNASNFRTTSNGTRVVEVVQTKTGTRVVVPLINDSVKDVVDKYNGNLPHISDVIINRYIKQIAKDLSDTVPSLKTKVETLLTLHEKGAENDGRKEYERNDDGTVIKARYDLISTHTCRRSCITNLYKSGLFSIRQLMSISGHKTERVFYEYIKEGADELADEINAILKKAESTNADLF